MGKIVKKITKPISKVLDKIVPNEIKPFLPYVAAIAPFMLPAGFTIGGLSPQLSRAIASGAINLGSQASQEGAAERGINPLSLALSAGSGYLSTPGAGEALEGMKAGALGDFDTLSTLDQTRNLGITGLQKASEFMSAPLQPGGSLFSKAGLQAVATPVIGAATEQAYNAALDAQRKYEKDLADYTARTGQALADSNATRIKAITSSMTNAGFGTSDIESALRQIGLLSVGGRVGYKKGGAIAKAISSGLSRDDALGYYNDWLEAGKPGSFKDFLGSLLIENYATGGRVSYKNGGRMGYAGAGIVSLTDEDSGVIYRDEKGNPITKEEWLRLTAEIDMPKIMPKPKPKNLKEKKQNGGIIGLMNGGQAMEMDYRGGGFIPIGEKERADDVPARLSKNEFVMTADAVRAAGGGSVNEGARRMYQLMNALEAKV